MSGFLGHLIQRSLIERTVLRPRPVSLFEPLQPASAPDTPAAAPFEFEPRPAFADRLSTHRRFAEALDPDTRSAAPSEAVAPPVDEKQRQPASMPRPPAPMTPRDAAWQGQPRVSLPPASTATPAAAHEHDTAAEPAINKAPSPFVEEMTPPASKQAEAGHAKPRLPQRPHAAAPTRAATESEWFDQPVALPSRRLQVQGKMPAHPDSQPGFERPPAPAPAQRSAPLAPDQAVARGASPQRPVAAESAVRSIASASDPLRSLPRKEPGAPAQAILAPRLPPQPVAHPVQPAVSQPAEPAVHVTIGRVEIRAVSAPAAPKRPAPSKPALSLSDYLDRRSGGRR